MVLLEHIDRLLRLRDVLLTRVATKPGRLKIIISLSSFLFTTESESVCNQTLSQLVLYLYSKEKWNKRKWLQPNQAAFESICKIWTNDSLKRNNIHINFFKRNVSPWRHKRPVLTVILDWDNHWTHRLLARNNLDILPVPQEIPQIFLHTPHIHGVSLGCKRITSQVYEVYPENWPDTIRC